MEYSNNKSPDQSGPICGSSYLRVAMEKFEKSENFENV